MTVMWSFSYHFSVKLFLNKYGPLQTSSIPADPKHSILKGLQFGQIISTYIMSIIFLNAKNFFVLNM